MGVINFYILDLENVATASRRCIGVVSKTRLRSACGWITPTTVESVVAECTRYIRWSTVTLQFHYLDLFWISRISCHAAVGNILTNIASAVAELLVY